MRTGDELTLGQRAADWMRNTMGSWGFVGLFLTFLLAWATVNALFLHDSGWDPYPFILLNLFLSMLAAIQGAILLIAAKRSDQVSAELAEHDYQTDQSALAKLEALSSEHAKLRAEHARLSTSNRRQEAMLKAIAAHLDVALPSSSAKPRKRAPKPT